MGCLTTAALTVGGALLAPVTGGLSTIATGSLLGTAGIMAAGGAAGYLAGQTLDDMGNPIADLEMTPPTPMPEAIPEEQAYQKAQTGAIETQTLYMQKQMEQMDQQLADQKKMNDTIDKYIADQKADEEAQANDPVYQSRLKKENEIIDFMLEFATTGGTLTPEQTATIDAQWGAFKEAGQAEIQTQYDSLLGKIASGKAEDLATIDADYADLSRKIDREIPDKMTQTWRTVSPLMRDSATAAHAMASLAKEVSRVKEDLIQAQGKETAGITRRATEATTQADTAKANAAIELAKQTEVGKLGAYETQKATLGAVASSIPPYYATNLQQQQQQSELQSALYPYTTKLGLSGETAKNLYTAQLGAATLGQTSGAAAGQLYTQRYQPWQTGLSYTAQMQALNQQSSMNAYNQRMALLGAVIGGGSRLGAAVIGS